MYTLIIMTPTRQSHSRNSDILAPTPTVTCSLSPLICLLTQLWHIHFPTCDMLCLTFLTCSLSPLTISLRWEQAGSGVILTLTSLTIWLRWEQADRGGSGLAGMGETSFTGSSWSGLAGSKLVAVDLALLVGVKLTSLGASCLRWIGLRW